MIPFTEMGKTVGRVGKTEARVQFGMRWFTMPFRYPHGDTE